MSGCEEKLKIEIITYLETAIISENLAHYFIELSAIEAEIWPSKVDQ